jgi:hypothetical protein
MHHHKANTSTPAQEEFELHIPTDPTHPENCVRVPDPTAPEGVALLASGVANREEGFRDVAASDPARQESEHREEARRGVRRWVEGPFVPLYPDHPVTQPGYTPQPCVLGDACLTELELKAAKHHAHAPSPHKHAHAHSAPARGGPPAPGAAPRKRSSGGHFDRVDDGGDTASRSSKKPAAAKAPRPRKSAQDRKQKQMYAAGELGPPKTQRGPRHSHIHTTPSSAASVAESVADESVAGTDAGGDGEGDADMVADEDTGIREEGDDNDEDEQQQHEHEQHEQQHEHAEEAADTAEAQHAQPQEDPSVEGELQTMQHVEVQE